MNSKTVNGAKCLLYLFGLLVLALPVQGASFDCGKAGTKVENLICDNPEISKLDDELSVAYKVALKDGKQVESIKQTQKRWMKVRNGCADAACVKSAYESRLHVLSQGNESAKQVATKQPTQANAKVDTPIQTNAEDTACLTPKIDWRNYEWTLITGNGLPVCEEMLAYVKSRPKDIAPPTCPEERLPSNGNWTRPKVRILSEEEKQALLRDIPEKYRQKPRGPFSYEREIAGSRLRVIRGDITRDGIPESLLAMGGYDDLQQTCERSKRCARPGELFKGGIVLVSDSFDLLPMNDEGTQVNWYHATLGNARLPRGGEIIFYKGLPYWLTGVSWSQSTQDNFTRWAPRTDNPYSAIFTLSEIFVGTGKRIDMNPSFKDVTAVAIDSDPESSNVCRFGYFHRDNLKQNPPVRRK